MRGWSRRQERSCFRVKLSPGESLLEALEKAGVHIEALCGGRGLCGKCRVRVASGASMLRGGELPEGWRLACQVKAIASAEVEVEVPRESLLREQRLLSEGLEPEVELSPAITVAEVEVDKPSLRDQRADSTRLLSRLKAAELTLQALRKLPHAARSGRAYVVKAGSMVVDVSAEKPRILGLAFDLGTTKLAGSIVDLETGGTLASGAALNPQVKLGEDVITRAAYAIQHGVEELNRLLVDGLNKLARSLAEAAAVKLESIREIVAVGNTVMHHTLLSLPLDYLTRAPFTPVLGEPATFKASELNLKPSEALVYLPPPIAGFVGSDALAGVLAVELAESSMLIDLGTNTEVALSHQGKLYVCSAAAGPAFEGATLSHGVRASPGAIERVWIDPECFKVYYRTVGGEPPTGLCGSGAIDLLAEAIKVGAVDETGRILPSPITTEVEGQKMIVATWVDSKPIGLTQRDVRELQLAKAAVHTAAQTLIEEAGVRELARLHLAGAFGTYLSTESAARIGMLPSAPVKHTEYAGNTALAGAKALLKSTALRAKAEQLAKSAVHIELAAHPSFQERFLKALMLKPQQI